jgi:PAS domain S-box-containing protein
LPGFPGVGGSGLVGRAVHYLPKNMNSCFADHAWDERTSAPESLLKHSGEVFASLFERCADAIWLYDPQTAVLLDCNQAAVELIGAQDKQQVLRTRPEDISPPLQPDGSRTADKTAEVIAIVEREKRHCFEWVIRRLDGRDVPVEVSSTAVPLDGKSIHVVISRDISEHKKAERELLELTQALERRVSERTAELSTSEARFRAMVEHAPEAIVVYSADTGRFLFGNQHACDLYGVPMSKLAELTPADVSPAFQSGGRRTSDVARETIAEALAGRMPVFEWIHQQPSGRLIPTEVRLLRLPAEGQNLIRASIIDNTERKRAERALRESEAKFRALFEGSSHGVVLHDEKELLEVNPAAVRIMGRQSAQEMLGRHPSEMAPPCQPNGESSEAVGRRHITECLSRGSARFEWVASDPNGAPIPLEVSLTRIEWSGRQIIQAFITDIRERKQTELALREANSELHREIEQRRRAEESLRERVRMSTLNAEVAVTLNSRNELQPMLQRCSELIVQHLEVAFVRIWLLNAATETLELQASAGCYTHLDGPHSRVKVGQYKIGWIAREKKPLLTNSVPSDSRISDPAWAVREGMVGFAGYPLLFEDRVLGVLAMFARHPLPDGVLNTLGSVADSLALGVERKRAQTALEESEARFSSAFQASPLIITISRMSDAHFVLVNDAFVNWSGYSRDEILGRNGIELGMWERQEDRQAFWADLRRTGSIRERECRFRNRAGRRFTMLISSDVIQINHEPHLLGMALDITQRKQAEVDMLKALGREKELSQLKTSFVSMVSHEFRTPLGIIQSSAELLRAFYHRMTPEERDEQLESIARNTRRMAGMMEGVLVLSRLDAGRLDFQPAPLQLNLFFRRVVDEVLSATGRRCHIDLALGSVLPEAQADEQLLGHIFTNLLSNAVKYSEPGTTVHFGVARDREHAVCVVGDRGIGISEADQQQLFKAFHRGGNVGTRPGTGLGLLLVKRCAELHGGTVELNSKIGEGTTVTVKLPVFGMNHEKDTGH